MSRPISLLKGIYFACLVRIGELLAIQGRPGSLVGGLRAILLLHFLILGILGVLWALAAVGSLVACLCFKA
jgi:hypothetical protein